MARVGQKQPLDIVWRAYMLRPDASAPPPPAEYVQQAWEQSVKPLSQQLGIDMVQPDVHPHTRLTHEAVAFALKNSAKGDEFVDAVFAAYWQEGQNIGEKDVLCTIASGVGIDADAMQTALDDGSMGASVDEELQLARAYQISAVPSLIIADRYLVRGLPDEEGLLKTVRDIAAATS